MNYIYQGQDEIGSIEKEEIVSLRVLGTGKGAEIGASVLIQIHHATYIPLHDHNGSIIRILDIEGNSVEDYTYTAFGEVKITEATGIVLSDALIPWLFSSKRLDRESGLVYFGRRYYSPNLGRWITQDPLGFSAGPNLYAYVLNSPLIHIDLYGLEASSAFLNYGLDLATPLFAYTSSFYNYAKFGSNQQATDCEWFSNSFMCKGTPEIHEVGTKFNKNLGIGFDPGINTSFEGGLSHAQMISDMAGGYKVDYISNPTNGFVSDSLRYLFSSANCWCTPSVKLRHNVWDNFFDQADSWGTYLQHAHSEGVNNIRNALLSYNEERRDRIIVIGVAPSCYIDRNLCKKVHYCESTHDIVNRLDIIGRAKNRDLIKTIPRHPAASWFDHDFQSATYKDYIQDKIDYYLKDIK